MVRTVPTRRVGGSPAFAQSLLTILRACALSMASLYVGYYLGYKEGVAQTSRILSEQAQKYQEANQAPAENRAGGNNNSPRSNTRLFPQDTNSFVAGASLIDRKEFAYKFDTGVPLFGSNEKNNQVLLLHARGAMPQNSSHNQINTRFSVDEATQNCNYMSLVLTEPDRNDQCIAIMGQFNSYHIAKFMRIVPDQKKVTIDNAQPLRWVKRGTDVRPFLTATPSQKETSTYWKLTLQPYLANLQTYLDKLKPIAEEAQVKNTVIVMVSNFGQSELLINFVCNAQKRQLDTSMVLVFATDVETYHLSQSLGLHTFYDADLFHQIPKEHAPRFGDKVYKMAIFSKLYCVHLVGLLGYDYLFQDVDLVWYKHPLDYFHAKELPFKNKNFDMYMQNDGNYAQFYMPYSGNTGFYYVKNNARTVYFMNHFLVSGDLILSTSTHQAPFLSIMSEHASLHGLKVKILPGDQFPGGYHYNTKPLYMKYLLKAVNKPASVSLDPWIFHMSWTLNKSFKLQYFEQMGEWFVNPTCLPGGGFNVTKPNQDLKQPCCLAEPIAKCHFRDKPSVIPCHDSPPSEGTRASWYPQ